MENYAEGRFESGPYRKTRRSVEASIVLLRELFDPYQPTAGAEQQSPIKAIDVDRRHEHLLIHAAQHGNAQAFTELYDAYVDKVYRYIYYRVFVVAVAEDLTADVFVKALEGLSSYEDRSTPLVAWLYRIAHARVVDYLRSPQYRANHRDIDEVVIGIDDEMDNSLISKQQVEIVRAALLKLSAEYQQIIVMRFIEGNNL